MSPINHRFAVATLRRLCALRAVQHMKIISRGCGRKLCFSIKFESVAAKRLQHCLYLFALLENEIVREVTYGDDSIQTSFTLRGVLRPLRQ
jgi:hypothetical protein